MSGWTELERRVYEEEEEDAAAHQLQLEREFRGKAKAKMNTQTQIKFDLKDWVPKLQLMTWLKCLEGEESQHFKENIIKIRNAVASMPLADGSFSMKDKEPVLKYFNTFGSATFYMYAHDPEESKHRGAPYGYGEVDLGYGKDPGYFSLEEPWDMCLTIEAATENRCLLELDTWAYAMGKDIEDE